MICFNHNEKQAVGVCKHCCKGVCEECAVDVGGGIACKGSCEDEVTAITAVMIGSSKTYSKSYKGMTIMGCTFIFFSLLLLVTSYENMSKNIFLIAFLGAIGVVGIYMARAYKLKK